MKPFPQVYSYKPNCQLPTLNSDRPGLFSILLPLLTNLKISLHLPKIQYLTTMWLALELWLKHVRWKRKIARRTRRKMSGKRRWCFLAL